MTISKGCPVYMRDPCVVFPADEPQYGVNRLVAEDFDGDGDADIFAGHPDRPRLYCNRGRVWDRRSPRFEVVTSGALLARLVERFPACAMPEEERRSWARFVAEYLFPSEQEAPVATVAALPAPRPHAPALIFPRERHLAAAGAGWTAGDFGQPREPVHADQ